jgi:hypothetical protein
MKIEDLNGEFETDDAAELVARLSPLWRRGVKLALVSTHDIVELVALLDAWFVHEVSSQQILSMSDAVSLDTCAHFYEAGSADYVGYCWQRLFESNGASPLASLIEIAMTSKLRQLLPYTSMDTLCLSRCTGFPFLTVGQISPIGGKDQLFSVTGPQGELGQGRAQQCVGLLVSALPNESLVAIHGTAETVA